MKTFVIFIAMAANNDLGMVNNNLSPGVACNSAGM